MEPSDIDFRRAFELISEIKKNQDEFYEPTAEDFKRMAEELDLDIELLFGKKQES